MQSSQAKVIHNNHSEELFRNNGPEPKYVAVEHGIAFRLFPHLVTRNSIIYASRTSVVELYQIGTQALYTVL